MGVYIKGMEMPKTCHECRLYEGDIYYCSAADKEIDISDSSEGKCQFCPLIPVSPHGDLIGREWLVDIALHLMNTAKNDDIANGVKWLLQYIIESPTIIPAEEGET